MSVSEINFELLVSNFDKIRRNVPKKIKVSKMTELKLDDEADSNKAKEDESQCS